MKKFFNSLSAFWIYAVGFYVCCIVFLISASTTFGYSFGYRFYIFLPAVYIIFFPALVSLVVTTFNLVKEGRFKLVTRLRINMIFLSAVSIVAELIIAYFIYCMYDTPFVLLFSVLAYTVFIIWLIKLMDAVIKNNFYSKFAWYRFYQQFPINTSVGWITAILSGIVAIYFFSEIYTSYFSFMCLVAICILSTVLVGKIASYAEGRSAQLSSIAEDKIKAEQMKTELITNVSHDIKTPLTSIINYTDLITTQNLGEQQLKEYTYVINNKSQRLKALIEDLIEASKAGTGNISLDFETINLCEIIGQIAGEYDEQLGKKNIDLILNIPQEPMNISADGRHLWRVLENIFSNSVKYSMEGTRIYADLNEGEGRYIFTLKNVSKEALNISPDELTEQFVRGERSRHTEGSGLGLYIAKSLTQAMNGEFDISISGDMFEVIITFGEEK